MTRQEITDEIVSGKRLSIVRDDLGLVSKASLFNPKDQTSVDVDIKIATLMINGTAPGNMPLLGRLTPRRFNDKLGYLDIGCPENGSEWYCLVQ